MLVIIVFRGLVGLLISFRTDADGFHSSSLVQYHIDVGVIIVVVVVVGVDVDVGVVVIVGIGIAVDDVVG